MSTLFTPCARYPEPTQIGGYDGARISRSMGYALRLNLSVGQIEWELAASRRKLLDAIASATPRGMDVSLYGALDLVSSHEQEHTGWIKRWRAQKGL